MTTRNFRVKNGLSVGDIVISSSTNKITGLSTAEPDADGDMISKAYLDTRLSALSSNSVTQLNSSATVTDTGADGAFTVAADGGNVLVQTAANTTITASADITLAAGADVNIPVNVGLAFGDGGEHIETDNTDLTVTSGGKINLTATSDVVIPANVGITFGTGEKIEGDNTDLTVTSGDKINLSATSDVQIPNNVGVLFGVGGEKIESDGTDLTITSTGALQLTVTGTTTVSGALTVTGNLTVNGTTTTVNSTNTTIDDNLLELNSGAESNANDCGIIIERGSTGNNAIFMWDESADTFALGTTTATASTTGDITIVTGTLVANLTGTATAAQYSDVAERFASDSMYEPGTVVALGGAAEITAVAEEASDEVFGVVSGEHQAAFKMNGGAGSDATHPYIAMTGRVDVKVIGPVNKGDRLVSASTAGYARAATKAECTAFNVIGRALKSKVSQDAGSVLAAVRVTH